jgi:exopolyphosphatase/guanosine-5'-triphosphate,3'-diphosphate pyrophosphatase
MRVAAVDLGTNSTRLLVADVGDGSLEEVARVTKITRLGEGVDERKRLLPVPIARVRNVLTDFRREAEGLGAERTLAVATSAVRDAENGEAFLGEIEWSYGFTTRLLTGDEEAQLTFRGVSLGREVAADTLVIDIGGGSTEFVVGDDHVRAARSVDIGCVRMTERHLVRDGVVTDPPQDGQIAAIRADIDAALDLAEESVPLAGAATLVGLAGTVTTIAAIALGLEAYDSEAIHHSRISFEQVREITGRLLGSTHAERAAIGAMHPGRVDVITSGALILLAVMERTGAREVVVSEHDILDGIGWSIA